MIAPTWLMFLWLAGTVGYALVILQVVALGLWRRWPSLLAYCFLFVAGACLLYLEMHVYRRYFWIYWIREVLLNLVRIWFVVDLYRAIPEHAAIPAWVRSGAVAVSVGAAAVAWRLSMSPVVGPGILGTILLWNRAFQSAWASAAILMLVATALTGFGIYLQAVRIATGYLVLLGASIIAAQIYASHLAPSYKLWCNGASGVVELAVIAYWCFSLHFDCDLEGITIEQDYELLTRLKELSATILPARHPEKVGTL